MIYVIFRQDEHIYFDTMLCTTDKDLALKCIFCNSDRYSHMDCWDRNYLVFKYGDNFNDEKFTFDDLLKDIDEQALIAGVELI